MTLKSRFDLTEQRQRFSTQRQEVAQVSQCTIVIASRSKICLASLGFWLAPMVAERGDALCAICTGCLVPCPDGQKTASAPVPPEIFLPNKSPVSCHPACSATLLLNYIFWNARFNGGFAAGHNLSLFALALEEPGSNWDGCEGNHDRQIDVDIAE